MSAKSHHSRLITHHKKRLVRSLLLIVIVGAVFTGVSLWLARPSLAAWWPSGTSWLKRQRLTITDNYSSSLTADTVVAVNVDTRSLYNMGKLKSDCSDIRILYQPNSQNSTDLDRYIDYPGGGSCSTSSATKVYFKLQAALNAGSSSSDYYLYYGNSGASTPANPEHAFNIGSNTALLVCPFDGSTTCIGDKNPTTSTGPVRFSGSNTAIELNGLVQTANTIAYTTDHTDLDNLPLHDFTAEWWQYMKSDGTSDIGNGFAYYVISNYGCGSGNGDGWGIRISPESNSVTAYFNYSTAAVAVSSSNAVPVRDWAHVAVTLNAQTKVVRIFVNGQEVTYDSRTTGAGTYLTETDKIRLGQAGCDTGRFHGLLDEMRISDTIRYTTNFTPSKVPFMRDNYTKLLFHFDQNGYDPRSGNTILDDSGHNLNMPYSGPVFYTSGIVGVDSSTDVTAMPGSVTSGTFAGHSGLFLEEETTNKIPNPSFENSTFNTGWTVSDSASVSVQTDPTWIRYGTHSSRLLSSSVNNPMENWPPSYSQQNTYSDTTVKRLSQQFQSSVTLNPTKALITIRSAGSASRWYHLEIQSDSSGHPSGTPLANGSSDCVAFADLPTWWTNIYRQFVFASAPTINPSTVYHLVLKTYTNSGCTTEQSSADSTNFAAWAWDADNHYTGGESEIMNESGTWTTQTGKDFIFELTQDGTLVTSVNTGNTNMHTLSAYVLDRTQGNVGGVVDVNVAQLVFQGNPQTTTYTEAGNGWWRLTYSAAGTSSAANYGIQVKSGKLIIVDGVQLEEDGQMNPPGLVTSYTDGSLGSGYTWNGSPNDSTSTRSHNEIYYANALNTNDTTGSISFWYKPNWDEVTTPIIGYSRYTAVKVGTGGWGWGNGFEIGAACTTINPCTTVVFDAEGYGTGTNSPSIDVTVTRDNWYHLVYVWNGNVHRLYVNSSDSGDQTFNTSTDTGDLYLGNSEDASPPFSTVSDLRIYNDPLTATEVADLYAAGMVSHTNQYEEDQFTAAPQTKGTNPVAVWHFDEGYGTAAHDSSTFKNDLSLYGAVFDASASGNQKSPLARNLKFNGSGAYTSRSAALANDFNFGNGSFTLSGWFRGNSTGSGLRTIISKFSTSGYQVYLNPNNQLCFGIDDDSSWGPDNSVCSSTTTGSLSDSRWHHFEAVKDYTSSITLYLDSRQVGSLTASVDSDSLNNTSDFYLGSDYNKANFWNGNLDEIVIYPYARTADQVKTDYLGPQTAVNIGRQSTDPLTNGIVGLWKMDESVSGSCNPAGDACDSSGNNLHGTYHGNTAPAAGKFSNGTTLDGTGDYIEVPNFGL